MNLSTLWPRAVGSYQRWTARVLERRPLKMQNTTPLISFSFDDFPRTALLEGGAILKHHASVGTYFASFGLMDSVAPTGRIFNKNDIRSLLEEGHELGCHTFEHCHAYNTAPREFEASIVRNTRALESLAPGVRAKTLSYPIGNPRAGTKRRSGRLFAACRGGGQTYNHGELDLNLLSAFFLEQSRDDLDAVYRMVDAACRDRGWLIFATHDVCDRPTVYGCKPNFFHDVVAYSAKSGARVLPVSQALELINGHPA